MNAHQHIDCTEIEDRELAEYNRSQEQKRRGEELRRRKANARRRIGRAAYHEAMTSIGLVRCKDSAGRTIYE